MSTRAELLAELEAVTGLGRARRDAAQDPFLLGVRPAATDWMTSDEIHRMCDIQAQLVPFTQQDRLDAIERVAVKFTQQDRLDAIERVAVKRAARRAAMAS